MKRYILAICCIWVSGLTTTVFAESLPQICTNKENEIQGMQSGVAEIEKEIAALEEKLRALKEQQKNLRNDSKSKNRSKKDLLSKIKVEQSKKKKMCAPLERCKIHEKQVDKWKSKIGPIVKDLNAIRKEIQESRKSSESLSQKVEEIRKEYDQLNCINLKAGETKQATIDRCHQLFSQWNSMQAEINKTNEKIASLKLRYKAIIKRMNPAKLALIKLHKQMRKTCDFSKRLPDLEKMNKNQEEYTTVQKDLDEMDRKVQKIRLFKPVKPKIASAKVKSMKKEDAKPNNKKSNKKGKLKLSLSGKLKAAAKGNVKKKPLVNMNLKAKASAKGKATLKPTSKEK